MPENPSEISVDLTKIVLNTLYLSLRHAIEHIARQEGPEAAGEFKRGLLEAIRNGSIDMALLEDAATFDFVVEKIEALPTSVEAPEGGPPEDTLG